MKLAGIGPHFTGLLAGWAGAEGALDECALDEVAPKIVFEEPDRISGQRLPGGAVLGRRFRIMLGRLNEETLIRFGEGLHNLSAEFFAVASSVPRRIGLPELFKVIHNNTFFIK